MMKVHYPFKFLKTQYGSVTVLVCRLDFKSVLRGIGKTLKMLLIP